MRSCGDCIACCTYLRIAELDKPGMTHCKYATLPQPEGDVPGLRFYTGSNSEDNCTVYGMAQRPDCCEGYHCLWKIGHGEEEDRPDKSLILFDRTKRVENAIEAKPLEENREGSTEGQAVIDRMSRSYGAPVIVLDFYERRVKRIAGRCV